MKLILAEVCFWYQQIFEKWFHWRAEKIQLIIDFSIVIIFFKIKRNKLKMKNGVLLVIFFTC